MEQKITTSLSENVLEITLNNPAKMNCMGFEMLKALYSALKDAEKETEIMLVLIKGAGERAFSTGADLKEFQSLNDEQAIEWIELGNEVFAYLHNFKKPTIALINGYAVGGGLEIALACDFRFATPQSLLGSPELQHGWLPGWGGMTRLKKLIGEAKAKEVVMLCQKIPAAKAYEMGLLTAIIESFEQNDELEKYKNLLKNLKPRAFQLAKAILNDDNRSTSGADVQFDVLAMQLAK